jgi:hypothetical protein
VHHGVGNFDAGWESVEDEAAGFLFEDVDEFAIGGQVVFVAQNGGGEMSGEGAGGLEIVLCRTAADEECVRAENLVGKVRLAQELVERDGEEFCLCVEWLGPVSSFGPQLRFGCERNLACAGPGCAKVFASDSTGKKCERVRLLDKGFEFVSKCQTLGCFGNEDDAGLGAELAGS